MLHARARVSRVQGPPRTTGAVCSSFGHSSCSASRRRAPSYEHPSPWSRHRVPLFGHATLSASRCRVSLLGHPSPSFRWRCLLSDTPRASYPGVACPPVGTRVPRSGIACLSLGPRVPRLWASRALDRTTSLLPRRRMPSFGTESLAQASSAPRAPSSGVRRIGVLALQREVDRLRRVPRPGGPLIFTLPKRSDS